MQIKDASSKEAKARRVRILRLNMNERSVTYKLWLNLPNKIHLRPIQLYNFYLICLLNPSTVQTQYYYQVKQACFLYHLQCMNNTVTMLPLRLCLQNPGQTEITGTIFKIAINLMHNKGTYAFKRDKRGKMAISCDLQYLSESILSSV